MIRPEFAQLFIPDTQNPSGIQLLKINSFTKVAATSPTEVLGVNYEDEEISHRVETPQQKLPTVWAYVFGSEYFTKPHVTPLILSMDNGNLRFRRSSCAVTIENHAKQETIVEKIAKGLEVAQNFSQPVDSKTGQDIPLDVRTIERFRNFLANNEPEFWRTLEYSDLLRFFPSSKRLESNRVAEKVRMIADLLR